jgi:hypothetical protein
MEMSCALSVVGLVNGCEDPRIDGVRRNRDEISTAVGSMLFAGKEKRGGMGEPVLRLLGIPSLRRPPGRKEIYQRAER